jgi:hypothetical protein
MRTSLNKILQIESHLLNQLSGEDEMLFQANLLLDKDFQKEVYFQQRTYQLVKEYGRKQIIEEIESVHRKLFSAPEHRNFRRKILGLFRS